MSNSSEARNGDVSIRPEIEAAGGKFTIITNAPKVKVSWMITAVRQDPYAKAHPIIVEQTKPANERGFYIHPEVYGQPKEEQTEWGRHPRQMQHLKAMRTARPGGATWPACKT